MERVPEPDSRWQLPHPDAIVRREWDGEAVVYNDRTGATHLLGAGAASLLAAVARASNPPSTDALVFAAFPDLDNDDASDRIQAEAALLELERSGLIERLRP